MPRCRPGTLSQTHAEEGGGRVRLKPLTAPPSVPRPLNPRSTRQSVPAQRDTSAVHHCAQARVSRPRRRSPPSPRTLSRVQARLTKVG
eukprot:360328-Chlamydomonas_euryale.AAC.3